MRKEYFIDATTEAALVIQLCESIKHKYPKLSPENTLVLMVSPDYSATAAMHVAHALSKDGEMCEILPIHVPYPDEKNIEPWISKAKNDLSSFHQFCKIPFENYLLVEAGVIRGGTYTWLTNLLHMSVRGNVITTALFENVGSKFKSDIVCTYYNDEIQDLTFYYERENKHWS